MKPLQEIVHDALKEGGFDLTTVAFGQEAVAMIESGVVKYSALVTDVNLKGPMKGWEIARLVRQIDPAFPMVCMTGAAADDWASEGCPTAFCCKSRLLLRNWLRRYPSCSTKVRRPKDALQSGSPSTNRLAVRFVSIVLAFSRHCKKR